MAIPQTKTHFTSLSDFQAILQRPENVERLLELINGEIIEKVPTEQHGMIAVNIASAIRVFTAPRKLGRVAVEARYELPADQQTADQPHSRIPDVSFTSKQRGLPLVTKGAVPEMPDLAIEIQSPKQSDQEMLDTAEYYLSNGSRMVLLVYPDRQIVEQRTPTWRRLLTLNDIIDFQDVIAEFSLPVRDVFDDPADELEETAE